MLRYSVGCISRPWSLLTLSALLETISYPGIDIRRILLSSMIVSFLEARRTQFIRYSALKEGTLAFVKSG